jgi:hypothetical protein
VTRRTLALLALLAAAAVVAGAVIAVLLVSLYHRMPAWDTPTGTGTYPQVLPLAEWPAYDGDPGTAAAVYGAAILGGRP